MQPIRLERFVFGLLGLVLAVFVLKQLSFILQPLFIALFVSYFTRPLRDYLRRHSLPGWAVNAVVLMAVVAALLSFGWIVTSNTQRLIERAPDYQDRIETIRAQSMVFLDGLNPKIKAQVMSIEIPWAWVGTALGAGAAAVFSFLGTLAVVAVVLFFMFLESSSFEHRLQLAFGKARSQRLQTLYERISDGIMVYIRIKALVSLLVALWSTLVMVIFGVDFWLFWGLLIFVGNFIPYVGSIVSVICPTVLLLLQTGSGVKALVLLGLLTTIQRLIETFLEPHLASKSLNLSPLVVILFFAFWAWLWGLVGMLLAMPLLVVLKVVLENIPEMKGIAQMLGVPDSAESRP